MNLKYFAPLIIFSSVFFAGANNSYAQTVFTQAEALDYALEHNPELQSLKVRFQSQATAIKSEASTFDSPELEFEHLWGAGGNTKWNAGVSQGFDWPGAYGARKRAAQAESDAYKYLFQAQWLEIRTKVKENLAEGVYLHKRLELLEKVLDNMEKLAAYINTGYKQGQLTILDVKKSNLELFNLRTQVADLRELIVNNEGTCRTLCGNGDVKIDMTNYLPEPMLEYEEYLRSANENNPTVQASRQSSVAATERAKANRLSRYPGFSIGYRHAYEEQTHFNGFSIGLKLPFFSNRGASTAAQQESLAAKLEASMYKIKASSEIQAAYTNAQARKNHMEELNAATLDATYPDLLLMAYKGGEINVITYMQELNYYLDARNNFLATDYAYRLSLISLNQFISPTTF